MVERKETEIFEDFEGVVQSVQQITNENPEIGGEQIYIVMKPTNREIKGVSGCLHEWINIPATATETQVPEASNIDKYLQELEILNKDLKKVATIPEVFAWMVNKKFKFVKKTLGKSFSGYKARSYWVPITLFE